MDIIQNQKISVQEGQKQQNEQQQINSDLQCQKYDNFKNLTKEQQIQFQHIHQSIKNSEENPSIGEQQLKIFRLPNSKYQLPDSLKICQKISYDTQKYDFQSIPMEILGLEKPEDLINFQGEKNPFSYDYAKWLRTKMAKSKLVEKIYTSFIKEVIGPHIMKLLKEDIEKTEELQYQEYLRSLQQKENKNISIEQQMEQNDDESMINIQKKQDSSLQNSQIQEKLSEMQLDEQKSEAEKLKITKKLRRNLKKKCYNKFQLMYQYPPTLRVHPSTNPPKPLGKVHRDAEFGHQPGEINFWMPITKAEGGATLWCETEPLKGDFQPFVLNYGELNRFWGVNCRHTSGVNDTGKTRISFDFRVAPQLTFDKEWALPQTHYHNWKVCEIDLQNSNEI